MKRTIRNQVWETNSSSVHSLCICTKEDYDKWLHGELYYDRESEILTDQRLDKWDEDTLSYEEYCNDYEWFEQYEYPFKTPSGDQMVAFGYYGEDR